MSYTYRSEVVYNFAMNEEDNEQCGYSGWYRKRVEPLALRLDPWWCLRRTIAVKWAQCESLWELLVLGKTVSTFIGDESGLEVSQRIGRKGWMSSASSKHCTLATRICGAGSNTSLLLTGWQVVHCVTSGSWVDSYAYFWLDVRQVNSFFDYFRYERSHLIGRIRWELLIDIDFPGHNLKIDVPTSR